MNLGNCMCIPHQLRPGGLFSVRALPRLRGWDGFSQPELASVPDEALEDAVNIFCERKGKLQWPEVSALTGAKLACKVC